MGVDLPSARVQQDRETRARDDGVATRLGSCVRRGDWRQQGREQAAWTTLARAKCTRFSKHGKHRRRVNAKEAAACPRLAQMSAAVLRAALGGRGGGWCGCARVDGCEGALEQGDGKRWSPFQFLPPAARHMSCLISVPLNWSCFTLYSFIHNIAGILLHVPRGGNRTAV